VEFAFQRYYRLDCSAERGLCERHARSAERVPAALKPAVTLAHLLKDLCHPQDQAWMRHLFADAALNRFKHLEATAGLRSNVQLPDRHHGAHTSLDELTNMDTKHASPYQTVCLPRPGLNGARRHSVGCTSRISCPSSAR
jgi:hypothetical protein